MVRPSGTVHDLGITTSSKLEAATSFDTSDSAQEIRDNAIASRKSHGLTTQSCKKIRSMPIATGYEPNPLVRLPQCPHDSTASAPAPSKPSDSSPGLGAAHGFSKSTATAGRYAKLDPCALLIDPTNSNLSQTTPFPKVNVPLADVV